MKAMTAERDRWQKTARIMDRLVKPGALDNLAKALGSPEADEVRHWAERAEAAEAEVKRLREGLAEAKKSRDFTSDWYKERFERMDRWMRENASPEAKEQYFSIQANGQPTPWESSEYVETIHGLTLRAKSSESKLAAQSAALEKARGVLKGVAIMLRTELKAYNNEPWALAVEVFLSTTAPVPPAPSQNKEAKP